MAPAESNRHGGAVEWSREAERLYGERLGLTEFHREAWHRSSRRRELSCGCTIDAGELYRYSVSKLRGVSGLVETAECDYCQRAGSRY